MISEISVSSDIIVRYHSECKIFNPFEINEDDSNILEYQGDLDPDKSFFNQHSHSLLEACNYQTGQTFNNYVNQKGISNNIFSLFHLNIRSIPANISSLLSDMENLDHRFSVTGLTETRLNPSNTDAYGIDGYNHVGITRSNKNGGGVSLFMSNEISFFELTEFTKVQEYIECLFLKKIISKIALEFSSVLYITPTCTSSMQELIKQGMGQKLEKSCFRCKKNTWHVESNYILQPPKYLIIVVNQFRYINNNFTKDKCSIPMDMTIVLGLRKFSLPATIDHHGPSMYSGHYIASTNCCKRTFYCNNSKITEFEIIDTKTPLLLTWQCIT